MRTYDEQFPLCYAIPKIMMAALYMYEWNDRSWGNDSCPRFEHENGWEVWIEAKNPSLRETADTARYTFIGPRGGMTEIERTADAVAFLASIS